MTLNMRYSYLHITDDQRQRKIRKESKLKVESNGVVIIMIGLVNRIVVVIINKKSK
jgi:hypothetical protein